MLFGKFFISGRPVIEGRGGGPVRRFLFFLSPFVFSFGLTLLYHGMRGVMRLGGFVASGGPYEIAHQAPDWVWMMPVSVMLMLFPIFTSIFSGSRISGPNIMALSWSAIFISLGWNFVEFGFGIGIGGELAIGWVICAVMFILMGILPLIFILRSFVRSLEARSVSGSDAGVESPAGTDQMSWSASLLLQVALCAAGVWLGILVFGGLG